MKKVSVLGLACAMACLTFTAVAANNEWKGANGGDIATTANWSQGLPTTVRGCFATVPSSDYRVTLSKDLTLYGLQTGAQNVQTTVDLGGHTLTLTATEGSGTVRFDKDGSTMVFMNGTLTVPSDGQCRIVQNSATVVIGRGAEVTMEANIVGAQAGKTGNEVRVQDGGVFKGYVSFQNNTARNRFIITDANTHYDFVANHANGASYLGLTNTIEIVKGATASNTVPLHVGEHSDNGNYSGCNLFRVSGSGAKLEQLKELIVGGSTGSDSNRVEILNGAYVYLTGNHHGLGCIPNQSGSFTGGVGNEILVSGEGSKLFQDGTSQYLRLGRMSVPGYNRLVVADGAEADIRCLDVNGIGNEVVLSNGTLTIQRLFEWTSDTHEAAANDSATLRFQGKSPQLVFTSSASNLAFSNTCFVVSVPETGFGKPLISSAVNITLNEGCTFTFEGLDEFVQAGGRTLPLVAVTGSGKNVTIADAVLNQIKSAVEEAADVSVTFDVSSIGIFLRLDANLPQEYEKLPFVNATAAQWVDTEYMPASASSLDVDAEVWVSCSEKTGYKTVLSINQTAAATSSQKWLQIQSGSGSLFYRFDYNRTQNNNVLTNRLTEVNRIRIAGNRAYFNGELCFESTAASFTLNHSLVLLGAIAANGTISGCWRGNCYGAKLYDTVGGVRTLVADMVPAIETATSTVGFYDVVRNKFYHSGSETELNAPNLRHSLNVGKDITDKLSWEGETNLEAKDYCLLTNAVNCQPGSTHTLDGPKIFSGGVLQIGEIDGDAGELDYIQWYHYTRFGDMILAKGCICAKSQSYAYFSGGRSRVLAMSADPFLLGSSTAGNNQFGMVFGNGHQFFGDENAVLKLVVSGHVTTEQSPTWKGDFKSTCLWSGSPEYRGKWIFGSNPHVDLQDPAALGGDRELFAEDAIWISTTGSYSDAPIGNGYCREVRFNFDGTMPSKGRGIKIDTTRPVEFVVPTGHVVHCDMPVKVVTAGRKCYIHSHYWTQEVAYVTSKLSLGAWEGGRIDVTNRVAVRFASVGQTTATTLNMLDETPSFWTEVDENLESTYTTIGPNTTFTPYGGKIPLRVDLARVLPLSRETLTIPVLKIDTAAKVVTADDFVLVQDADFLEKTARMKRMRLSVTTEGTMQTVNLHCSALSGFAIFFR